MAIKLGEKELFPYLGDYRPVNIYKGEHKVAGWKWESQSGEELRFENTYNDFVEVEIDGKSYQEGEPSPDNPAEIHSLNDFDVVSQKSEGGVIDGVEVGGRNLLRNSGEPVSSSSYTIQDYELTENLEEGTEVTLSIKGEIASGKTHFRAYNSGGRTFLGDDISEKNEYGVYTTTFKWIENSLNEFLRIYHLPYAVVEDSTIEWIKLEKGNVATNWTPAPEDITENDNHPLIDKINFLLSEPLRSVGDVKDRLFKDSDGLWKVEWNVEPIHPEDGTRTIEETYGVLDSPIYEVLPQDYQDKLNNLRSFRDSNYVYTTGSIEPHLIGKAKVKDV